MDYNELLENIKRLMRVSIEPQMRLPQTLKIRKFLGVKKTLKPEDREAVIDGRVRLLPDAIERCITDIVALGYNVTFEGAINDLIEMHSAKGGLGITRDDALESIAHELRLCHNTFSLEVQLFSRMHKLVKSGMSNQDVWEKFRGSFPATL